jgi:hypothetical protein
MVGVVYQANSGWVGTNSRSSLQVHHNVSTTDNSDFFCFNADGQAQLPICVTVLVLCCMTTSWAELYIPNAHMWIAPSCQLIAPHLFIELHSHLAVGNVILGGASAPSMNQSMEEHGFWVCLNLEMGRAWLQLKGVAPTCVPYPICRRIEKRVPAQTEGV